MTCPFNERSSFHVLSDHFLFLPNAYQIVFVLCRTSYLLFIPQFHRFSKLAIVNSGNPLTAENVRSDTARLITNILGGVRKVFCLKINQISSKHVYYKIPRQYLMKSVQIWWLERIARPKFSYRFGPTCTMCLLAPSPDELFITAAEVRTNQRWLISLFRD